MQLQNPRSSSIWTALLSAVLVLFAVPGYAGHGLFSPAPGAVSGRAVLDASPADGKLWSNFAGVTQSSSDGGRTWRVADIGWPVRDLWVEPIHGQLLVGTDGPVLTYSRDGGETWNRRTLDPSLANFVGFTEPIVPTAEGLFILGPSRRRTFRSFDYGETWEPSEYITEEFGPTMRGLAAGPGGSPLVAWSSGGIYLSRNLGASFEKATIDLSDIDHVAVSATSSRHLLAWSDDGDLHASRDGGRTFVEAAFPNTPPIEGIDPQPFLHPENPDVILVRAVVTDFSSPYSLAVRLRSDDGGRSWSGPILESQIVPRFGATSRQSTVDACNPSTLYAIKDDGAMLLRSRDWGRTWQEVPLGPGVQGLNVVSSAESCRVTVSTTSGPRFSDDRGETWSLGRGYRVGEFNTIAFDKTQANRVFAAGLGGLYRSEDRGKTWHAMDNTLSGREVWHLFTHPDGTLLAEAAAPNLGRFFISEDAGASFEPIEVEGTILQYWTGFGAAAVDPQNPSRILATDFQAGTIESLDFGRTWRHLSDSLPAFDDRPTRSLVIDPRDPNRLWGTSNRAVVASSDGGITWEELLPFFAGGALRQNPSNDDLWTWDRSRLLHSTDDGQTWTEREVTSAQFRSIRDLTFDARNPDRLLMALSDSDAGPPILESLDGGVSWHPWTEGFESTIATGIAQHPGDPQRWILSAFDGLHWRDEGPRPACPSYQEPGLCLQRGRFEVSMGWRDFADTRGKAGVVPLQTDAAGLFTFFDEDNWEAMVKVLDGCGVNDHFWIFSAATTNIDYAVHVTDRYTGRYRQFFNALGEESPAFTDTRAFPCGAVTPTAAPAVATPSRSEVEQLTAAVGAVDCSTPDSPALCLGEDGRFRTTLRWRDFAGNGGQGLPAPVSSADSGLFTFFDADNWEILVKVLDGCGVNDRFWVFGAATTNVEFELEVTDRASGEVQTYRNPLGKSADAIVDTDAFSGCSGVGAF